MNNILNFLKPYITTALPLIIFIEITFALLLVIKIAHYIQYHSHEYGHISKLKKAIYNDKEIKFDNITIQVAKFKGFLIPTKIKTYSNYFKYLENKKQDANYQAIIKDIAIGGYEFSKKVTTYKLFWIICSFICISTLIFPVFTIFYNNNYAIVSLPLLLFITLAWLMCIVSIYLLLCKNGYGPNKLSTKGKISDHYIHSHPNEFKYLTLEEDSKYLQKEYKIILYIEIDLSDRKNPKTNIISRNKFYKLYSKYW